MIKHLIYIKKWALYQSIGLGTDIELYNGASLLYNIESIIARRRKNEF